MSGMVWFGMSKGSVCVCFFDNVQVTERHEREGGVEGKNNNPKQVYAGLYFVGQYAE